MRNTNGKWDFVLTYDTGINLNFYNISIRETLGNRILSYLGSRNTKLSNLYGK
jgi:hypothetical protein